MVDEKPVRHPGTVGVLQFFEYQHLPADLGVVSMQFHHLAHELVDRLPDSPELTVALRKLLEGKDAAVRAALTAGGVRADPPRPQVEQMAHDTLTQTVHLEVRLPDGMEPRDAGTFLASQLVRQLADRSAAEQSGTSGRAVADTSRA